MKELIHNFMSLSYKDVADYAGFVFCMVGVLSPLFLMAICGD